MLKTEANGFRNQTQIHYNTLMGQTAASSKFYDPSAQNTRKNTVQSSNKRSVSNPPEDILVNINVPLNGPLQEIKR